jgi:polysaccharide deacetylase family protein (PEP-CTERM system associated)
MNVMSIDVEEWYHILDSPATPAMERWASLESRLERNLEKLLALLDETGTHATLFWLGWIAERHVALLRRCRDAGHEIGSHGYGHLPCCKVGRGSFRQDMDRAHKLLEDLLGESVRSFRSPGFAINGCSDWFFEIVRETGHTRDSSVRQAAPRDLAMQSEFPVHQTSWGSVTEIPVSTVRVAGRRYWPLGGGYLRLMPAGLLDYFAQRIQRSGRPIVVYVHPRDVDLESPCLPLGSWGRFKFAVNRHTTQQKLRHLLTKYHFGAIRDCVTRDVTETAASSPETPCGVLGSAFNTPSLRSRR